jgi:hypothetical protein
MRSDVQHIIDMVSQWQGVTAQPHRFGGIEFNLGKVEIGHVHGHGLVDIPFTRKLRELLVAQDEALPHHLLSDSGWISFYLRQPDNTRQALRLMRLSYAQKRSRRQRDFNLQDELSQLAFGKAIEEALAAPAAEND